MTIFNTKNHKKHYCLISITRLKLTKTTHKIVVTAALLLMIFICNPTTLKQTILTYVPLLMTHPLHLTVYPVKSIISSFG